MTIQELYVLATDDTASMERRYEAARLLQAIRKGMRA